MAGATIHGEGNEEALPNTGNLSCRFTARMIDLASRSGQIIGRDRGPFWFGRRKCDFLSSPAKLEESEMNWMSRILVASAIVVAMSFTSRSVMADCGCNVGCAPACQPCMRTVAYTAWKTVVRCRPVTTYKRVVCRDACGCCHVRCVPVTRMVRTCHRVPVTCYRQVPVCTQCRSCCNPCASQPCCDPCASTCAPRRRGLLARLAHRHR